MKHRRRRRTAGPFWAAVVLLAVLTGAMLYTGDFLLSWAAFSLGVLLAGVLLWHLVTAALLSIRVQTEDTNPVKGQPAHLHVRIRNRAPFPILWMELSYETFDSLIAGAPESYILSLAPFARHDLSLDMTCPYRGKYRLGVTALTLLDPFGLLPVKHKPLGDPLAEVVVWPRRIPVPVSRESLAVLDEKPTSRRDYTEDLTSIREIRSWRDGDPLKRVHWKLTSRMGDWMVKEFDSTTRDEIAFVLDAQAGHRPWIGQIRYEDALIEAAFSFCAAFLEAGRPIRLTTHADDFLHLHGSDASDVSRFYGFLSNMVLNGSCSAGEMLEFESPILSSGGHLVVIGPLPDEHLSALLVSLASAGITITLVVAVENADAGSLPAEEARRLDQAGILCLIADPDMGILPARTNSEPIAVKATDGSQA
ncbi:MAG: DUF58 domain-containing protein [Clostridiaceae bacterium]|nr:DUF58 domain-containing protein [Clostridiaceae bacterium]